MSGEEHHLLTSPPCRYLDFWGRSLAKTWSCTDLDSGLAQHGAAYAGSINSSPDGWLCLFVGLKGNPWSLAAPDEEGCSVVRVLPGRRSSLSITSQLLSAETPLHACLSRLMWSNTHHRPIIQSTSDGDLCDENI